MAKRTTVVIIFLLAMVKIAAANQNPPCHESPSYIIVERPTDGVGTDLLVKSKEGGRTPACEYRVGSSDFEIKNESAEYFLALWGDLLILDSGTGPDPRGLIIWNVRSRKKFFTGSYSEPYEVRDGVMEYWLETARASEGNCDSFRANVAAGLGAAIETKVRLNLADLSVKKTSETRCAPRQ